jgi:hypothetical protein
MSTPTHFRKDFGRLIPCDDAASAMLMKIKHGDVVQVEIKRPRNIMHHRKFFALINLVFENQAKYESPEHLLAALKASVGHCDFLQGQRRNAGGGSEVDCVPQDGSDGVQRVLRPLHRQDRPPLSARCR